MAVSSQAFVHISGTLCSGECPRASRPAARRHELAKRNGEWGAGHLRAVVWTLILVSVIYVAVKVVPVLVNEYEFQDSIQNIARLASVNHQSNDSIKLAVLQEAQKQELPVQADQVKVEGAGGNVRIHADYSVTVDLKIYQWTLEFHPAAANNALF